jgi:cyclic pyranopterin phosphate synthase
MGESERELTHIDRLGRTRMVDVSEKEPTAREARAEAFVSVSSETMQAILDQTVPKGNVFETARLAGILAGKKTWEWIPLCHPIHITGIDIDFAQDPGRNEIRITSRVTTMDRTGVEMEAMVAASAAALTIYDMCKAIDRGISIHGVRLTYKSGGKSGTYERR